MSPSALKNTEPPAVQTSPPRRSPRSETPAGSFRHELTRRRKSAPRADDPSLRAGEKGGAKVAKGKKADKAPRAEGDVAAGEAEGKKATGKTERKKDAEPVEVGGEVAPAPEAEETPDTENVEANAESGAAAVAVAPAQVAAQGAAAEGEAADEGAATAETLSGGRPEVSEAPASGDLHARAGVEGEPADAENAAFSGENGAADAEEFAPPVARRVKEQGDAPDPVSTDDGDVRLTPERAKPEADADAPAQPVPGAQPAVATQEHAPALTQHSVDPSQVAVDALAGGRQPAPQSSPAATAAPQAANPVPPEVHFAEANTETIVRSVRAELLPNGGSMRIRLDPPQLGALNVTVQIQDGVITAAFETSSDEATRLLGHSLNHLKSVLESHGVAVDKLQVQQAPKDQSPDNHPDARHRDQEGRQREQDHASQQEQQRREMMRKMWRKIYGGADPLDLTA